jgi:murein DD-endopeptidase MepM/ murein hydrolase activator NlpD
MLSMKCWPIIHFKSVSIPAPGEAGSFWEDRGDRHHAGIDLYAPAGSQVVAVEKGVVLDVSVFTSADLCSYWNTTYSLLVQSPSGAVWR